MTSRNQYNTRRKRRRKPPALYRDCYSTAEEERHLRQAIKNSKLESQRPQQASQELSTATGPTFFPTVEEFEGNPIHYIEKIRPTAEQYGICKIVPPEGWNPPLSVDMNSKKKIQTKDQQLHRIQEGVSFSDGAEYRIKEYIEMAQRQTQEWLDKQRHHTNVDSGASNHLGPDTLEQHFWDIVDMQREYDVEYGNDVDTNEFGSGFPRSERGRYVGGQESRVGNDGVLPEPKFGTDEFYKESFWNLSNLPNCPDSILHHVKVKLLGINVPWLYFGNLFSTFCWHNEDNYLYSINYHHWGAPKQWYGVPGSKECAEGVEKVFKSYLSMKLRDEPDLLHHITTMFNPRHLQHANVPVYKLLQHPGEFIVTFPRAFHGGFSMGPNIGEAVNFATHDWISYGADASERYRAFKRPAVFSHERLTFTMATNLNEQKSYHSCKLLLSELKRTIDEELKLRNDLLISGVRDMSMHIQLPKNRLDQQLDEESADYDDRRLCHCCNYICFLSCVACECSQSKISCLRHSKSMCNCPVEKKYFMIWSPEEEMQNMYNKVKVRLKTLKEGHSGELKQGDTTSVFTEGTLSKRNLFQGTKKVRTCQEVAPGSLEDEELHKHFSIDTSPTSPMFSLPEFGRRMKK